MIPKKIHYCWFGGKPLPALAKKCIESWKKYLPDYEIIEWNESNFDVNVIPYTAEAYQVQKYAFVSDYARLWIIYKHGGIYFDVDVEVIKSLDQIIEEGPFLGCEGDINNGPLQMHVNPGLGFAASQSHEFLNEIIEIYHGLHFFNTDGSLNTKTIVNYTTELLCEHGLKCIADIQNCAGFYIYPKDYFSPKDPVTRNINLTYNTHTIHHYDGSWLPKSARLRQLIKEKLDPRLVKCFKYIYQLLKFK